MEGVYLYIAFWLTYRMEAFRFWLLPLSNLDECFKLDSLLVLQARYHRSCYFATRSLGSTHLYSTSWWGGKQFLITPLELQLRMERKMITQLAYFVLFQSRVSILKACLRKSPISKVSFGGLWFFLCFSVYAISFLRLLLLKLDQNLNKERRPRGESAVLNADSTIQSCFLWPSFQSHH